MCIFTQSCTITRFVRASDDEATSWFRGKTKKQIIEQFGPPTKEVSDGDDGSILVYEYDNGSTTTTSYTEYHTYYDTQYHKQHAYFYMNSKGICTKVSGNIFTKQETKTDYVTGIFGWTLGVGSLIVIIGLLVTL